ncbi:MAG: hypothetical protein ACYTFE_01565, partial [Planctomycetota bacterium]
MKSDRFLFVIILLAASITSVCFAADASYYIKKDTWQETVMASREAQMKEAKAKGGGVSVDFGLEEFTIATWIKTKSSGPMFIKGAGP